MALYHPLARALSLRDLPGCITPTTHLEGKLFENASSQKDKQDSSSSKNQHDNETSELNSNKILSPPLSPYQRGPSKQPDLFVSTKVYIPEGQFKIENYQEYDLVVNPWQHLDSDYKKRQFNFLDQYMAIQQKELASRRPLSERRTASSMSRKKTTNNNLTNLSDSDSEFERVRTRRIVKENSTNLSEYESGNNSTSSLNSVPSSPQRRKTVKPSSYASSPLAAQQAALIDENIPDYSPSSSLLPKGNNRCLKVEWKGQPMDLKDDPNLDKLHPAEVLLASILRLPCNVYLDSKRRLFFEKVGRLKKGQQFRRTDAQKACRIDVNKASRLFAAFERVGWLEDDLFAKYL